MKSYLVEKVQDIVQLMINRKYDAIEKMTQGVRLSANEIKRAIEGYGRILSDPPISHFDSIDIIEIADQKEKKWSVRLPLWTVEEGGSDLTMELTLIESMKGAFVVEFDDIHVL